MKRRLALFATALVAAAALIAPSMETALGGAMRKFRLTPGEMDDVIAMHGDQGEARYYLKYRLSNASGAEETPRIKLVLTTDTGKRYVDYRDAAVMKALKASSASKQAPATASSLRKAAMAADGEADAVAVFGAIDPNADELQVRVYGLWQPIIRDRKGRKFLERRVLVLDYSRSGDEYNRHDDPIKLVKSSEEVEGDPVEIPRARDQASE